MTTWQSLDPRTRAAAIIVAVAGAAAALATAWYLGSPLFLNQTVNESFPAAAPSASPKDAMAKPQEAMPKDAMAKPQEAMPKDAMPKPQEAMPKDAMAKSQEAMPKDAMAAGSEPVVLKKGGFTVVDSLHQASGTATVYRLADGKRVLRFEGFSATNGPDLYVYLSGHAMPRKTGELREMGDLNLGRLKGNVGNQNYELPDDVDLSKFKSVVIYCRQFSVVFSSAELAGM